MSGVKQEEERWIKTRVRGRGQIKGNIKWRFKSKINMEE